MQRAIDVIKRILYRGGATNFLKGLVIIKLEAISSNCRGALLHRCLPSAAFEDGLGRVQARPFVREGHGARRGHESAALSELQAEEENGDERVAGREAPAHVVRPEEDLDRDGVHQAEGGEQRRGCRPARRVEKPTVDHPYQHRGEADRCQKVVRP